MTLRRPALVLLFPALLACGVGADEEFETEPELFESTIEQGVISCSTRQDTGYQNGNAFGITVVTADGKPVELQTANAYALMQDAAAADGVFITISSGFRTMAEQQYFYACYVNCNCNNCNLAARPGYSNHQSGHALDLNTSVPGVYAWLTAHGAAFGFSRTVPSEAWHWEWWGGGPGGGPCGNTDDNCTRAEADGCGNFGCGCVDHQCNGIFCPGSGCSAQHAAACGGFGCGCADGQCNGGTCPGSGCTAKETLDCGNVGCGCVDHRCNGGVACAGSGCTWRETQDCAAFGVNCADHQCAGGFGPGSGCTGKETSDCTARGCGCVDHQCSGGSCAGTGCTARQALDCQALDAGCALGRCATSPTPDAGRIDGGAGVGQDAGVGRDAGAGRDAGGGEGDAGPVLDAGAASTDGVEPAPRVPLEPVTGSCAAAPGGACLALALWLFARPRRRYFASSGSSSSLTACQAANASRPAS